MSEKNYNRFKLVYTIKAVSEEWKKGIGVSKREIQKANNGHSPLVHSFSTFNRYMGVVKEFVNDMKEAGKRRVEDISYNDVREWLERKAGYCTEKTLKVNMSALGKYFETLERKDISQSIKRDFVDIYSKAKPSGAVEPFTNPQRVINSLRDERFKAVATLQYLTGARLGDVKKITINNNTVTINKSKGGKTRNVYINDEERLNRIEQAHNVIKGLSKEEWDTVRKEYPNEVHSVCVKLGERYTGTHAFRVNWAQEEYQRLTAKGMDEVEALKTLSQELGHERLSMSVYYLKK